MKKRAKILAMLFLALVMVSTSTGETIFVDTDAPGLTHNGSSWTTAFKYLQNALSAALSGDEIRVAQGIYTLGVPLPPPPPLPPLGDSNVDETAATAFDRTVTFQLINGVTVKGGYAGFGEPDPDTRDIELYETILSGDLAGNDAEVNDLSDLWDEPTRADNSYHVVTGSGTDATAVLDGFIITGGNANGLWYPYPGTDSKGGGMLNYHGSPTIRNCIFSGNLAEDWGGGLYNVDSSTSISNCTFTGNFAYAEGGIFNSSSSPSLINCIISGNIAISEGGGMGNYFSSPILKNCTLGNNSALWDNGGGMTNYDSNAVIINCTFSANCAYRGGGMYNHESSLSITNCTFVGNCAEFGGGMYMDAGSIPPSGPPLFKRPCDVTLNNCTFAQNSGNAMACYSYQQRWPSNLELTNCILWNDNNEIWNDDDSTITITYSNVQSGWPGEGNIDADPCFVDPGYWDANGTPGYTNDDVWVDGDYHLLLDSPCIDAGDPNYIAEPNETDLDGKPRVIGGQIDMGAYEYMPSIPAEARIVPRTINLASKGKSITCYIRLPEGYNVADIEFNSVFLEDTVPAASFSVDEQKQVATAMFSREELRGILSIGDIELTITGRLTDGTLFEGTDVIKVIDKRGGKK